MAGQKIQGSSSAQDITTANENSPAERRASSPAEFERGRKTHRAAPLLSIAEVGCPHVFRGLSRLASEERTRTWGTGNLEFAKKNDGRGRPSLQCSS
jgi:hypothetical protein